MKNKNSIDNSSKIIDLIPLSLWNKYFAYPTVSTLRHLVFTNKNNFNKVTRRIANRIYIKVSDFNEWVEETN